MKKLLLAAMVLFAAPANAALQIAGDVSGTAFSCVDQDACDTNPLIGSLGFGTASSPAIINGVQVFGSLHIQGANVLFSSSLEIINSSGSARTIGLTVGATDYLGPVGSFGTAGAGTFLNGVGSTIGLRYFLDSFNAQGADFFGDTPGISVTPFDYVATDNPDALSHSGSGAFSDDDLYSMTMQVVGTLVNGGSLVSRGQAIVTNVPEPATLGLLGLGMLGMTMVMRRSPWV